MVKQRKPSASGERTPPPQKDKKDTASLRKGKNKSKVNLYYLYPVIFIIGLFILGLIWEFVFQDLESDPAWRVVNLHPSPRVLNANSTGAAVSPERFWGSYRPQVYFGMKTRSPRSTVMGLMWMRQFQSMNLRHTCEQEDRLPSYGWLMHDGLSFGVQEIRDSGFVLTTKFVKRAGGDHGGDWTWRITADQDSFISPAPVISLMFYMAADTQGSLETHLEGKDRLSSVTGFSEELGNFTITFHKPVARESSGVKYTRYNYLKTVSPGLEKLTDIVKSSLSNRFVYHPPSSKERHYFGLDKPTHLEHRQGSAADTRKWSDFVVHQVTVQVPFQIEVLFESGSFHDRPNQLAGYTLTEELEKRRYAFDAKFEKVFGLESKGFGQDQVKFSKAALSNMLGGMGYFYGQSVVQSLHHKHPLLYPEGALFTAVPSRSFFPRGFLWDEGFHQLLLSKWDAQVTRDSISHWLDLINIDGWIPREQILGGEALSKVPAEFVVQLNENANPPTLFLVLQELVEQSSSNPHDASYQETLHFLRRLYPRLQAWFDWYNSTQSGPLPGSYRWRGRDNGTDLFLNPKTLTSGLDDYPRASHPSADERHVDLRCWMAMASGTMTGIARLLGEPHHEYERTHTALSDNTLLDELHWSEQLHAYSDYGNHTEAVFLQREKVHVHPGKPFPATRLVRSVHGEPKPQYVNALGYVSLFPLLLRLLDAESPKLGHVLRDMRDPDKLWTPYGLRSLSRADPMYLKWNTEHDGPYWRGPVWININYLAARALHHYGNLEGPYRGQAAVLYWELRRNVIENVYRQYTKTGYIWEQYDDSTGQGLGSHPFTGWSALTVLMMAEQY